MLNKNYSPFGLSLKEARAELGQAQRHLANTASTSRTKISHLEGLQPKYHRRALRNLTGSTFQVLISLTGWTEGQVGQQRVAAVFADELHTLRREAGVTLNDLMIITGGSLTSDALRRLESNTYTLGDLRRIHGPAVLAVLSHLNWEPFDLPQALLDSLPPVRFAHARAMLRPVLTMWHVLNTAFSGLTQRPTTATRA